MSHWSTGIARARGVLLIVVGALLLVACPPREKIELVNRDPGRFRGKEIAVAGHVVNSFSVMGVGAFELDDGTGRLWVFSDKYGVPAQGGPVTVTGVIQQGFSFGGRNFATILKETRARS